MHCSKTEVSERQLDGKPPEPPHSGIKTSPASSASKVLRRRQLGKTLPGGRCAFSKATKITHRKARTIFRAVYTAPPRPSEANARDREREREGKKLSRVCRPRDFLAPPRARFLNLGAAVKRRALRGRQSPAAAIAKRRAIFRAGWQSFLIQFARKPGAPRNFANPV